MLFRPQMRLKNRTSARNNAVVSARVAAQHATPVGKRARGLTAPRQRSYMPPEDWYEPAESPVETYRIIVQPPGKGFRHVVTPDDIRQRLSEFSPKLLEPLEVIQLSQMTRKKKTFPCYGMQWGSALYLYPIEESLVESFGRPPAPPQRIEARMYGGEWKQAGRGKWNLIWTEEAIRDFYLNNILIHELGHLLDNRNTSYRDRERFAEWFAVEHGYKPSRSRTGQASPRKAPRA